MSSDEGGLLRIRLVASSRDGTVFRTDLQAAFHAFYQKLLFNNVQVAPVTFTRDYGASAGGLVGEFVLSGAHVANIALVASLTEWFAGDPHRGLVSDLGGIRFEAASIEEYSRRMGEAIVLKNSVATTASS
jgi:hypothetical protein